MKIEISQAEFNEEYTNSEELKEYCRQMDEALAEEARWQEEQLEGQGDE